MASGFTKNGVDLDTIFKVRSSGKRADVGLQVVNVDVSNRFEKTGGGDLIAANTGFQQAGVDIKTMFRDITFGGALYATSNNNTPSGGSIGTGPFTTSGITITPGGGVGGYTYSWARQSGDATISISSSTTATPTWSASGTQGTSKSAVWRCTVTDAALATTTVDVNVTISFYNVLSVPLDKGSVSGSGIGNGPFTTDTVTGSPTGGAGGYTYAWEQVSGDAVTITSASSAATSFSGSATAPASLSGSYRLKATDSLGNVGYSSTITVTVTFNSAALNVTANKASVFGEITGSGFAVTDTVMTSVTGGTAPYSYFWERQSGDSSTSALPPNQPGASFGRSGSAFNLYDSIWRCRVTDNVGTIGYSPNVTVQLLFDF